MGVYIKGMEMPKSCDDCKFFQRSYPYWCDLCCRRRDVYISSMRPDWCPLEEAEPIKHGRWEWNDDNGEYFCSECKKSYEYNTLEILQNEYRYCPNCGAKMDEVKE